MPSKGSGSTFSEAFDNYLQNCEMCDSTELSNFMDSLESSSSFSPLYVGINVDHTIDQTYDYLSLFNSINDEYLAVLLSHFPKSNLHSQTFTNPSKLPTSESDSNNLKSSDHSEHCKSRQVVVLQDASEILLQDHFHVTLYFLGVDKKTDSQVKEDLEKVSKYLEHLNPDFKLMLNTLTLYEFSVCLMYRHLYKMPLPFEDLESLQDDGSSDELLSIRYLVLVPGVVFFAIVELDKPLFAIPPKDFSPSTHSSYSTNSSSHSSSEGNETDSQFDKLLKLLKDSVLIESYHSTHITLGTSKDYKAVISNQICQSLLHFLETNSGRNVHSFSKTKSSSNTPGFTDQLRSHLRVYNSGPCRYHNLRDLFTNSIPYLLSKFTDSNCSSQCNSKFKDSDSKLKDWNWELHLDNSSCKLDQSNCKLKEVSDSSLNGSLSPKDASSNDPYSDTSLYVSEDFKWFFFHKLPGTKTLHSETSQETYDWLIDVYVVAFEKSLRGHIHFNQK